MRRRAGEDDIEPGHLDMGAALALLLVIGLVVAAIYYGVCLIWRLLRHGEKSA